MSAGHDEPYDEPREEQPMTGTDLVEEARLVEPVAVGPGETPPYHADGAAGVPVPSDSPVPAIDRESASLLALVDRLTAVLERSDLGELEVTAGGTTIILRAPSAIERPTALAVPAGAGEQAAASAAASAPGGAPAAAAAPPAPAARPSVKAPLTGIFYGAPSPGATSYVSVGDHVSVGQIIGLIEAMKLFNEIKSDLAGRVVRVCTGNGALVKARQPLIEVEPA
jgi:acetyl-CoA carboxylase biotin carboxyl carrier protein